MNLNLIAFLILFPFVVAVIQKFVKNNKIRGGVTYIGAAAIILTVAAIAATWITKQESIELLVNTEIIDKVIICGEVFLVCLITYLSFKYKKYPVCLLSIVQTAMVIWVDVAGPELEEGAHLLIDRMSLIMMVIVGVIGSLICVYAVGYLAGYHEHHKEVEDRRPYFFMLLFVFLGAMFGLVLSKNLLWMDFFWEITSVCSFLLIGYTRTEEAVNNSFRALWMNLLGGLGFATAIVYTAVTAGTVDLGDLVAMASTGSIALLPIALLAFAALTKSAQMPFSSWLLGAMVAPTPSSALLHSATMVKAGVYLLIRLAPAMTGNQVGLMISTIGGFTFFAASMLAIAQSDGKKVLAYSTISNLGLITACAGIGTSETVWAAVFLIIFHAVSKSMLFQGVGSIENSLHSRDVEDMGGLLRSLPKLAWIMIIGICGMYLAPFGMLISKWAAISAFIDSGNVLMIIFLIFGSATTVFYWSKWLTKLVSLKKVEPVKNVTQKNQMFSLYIHACAMICLCFVFPLLSAQYVLPMIEGMYGAAAPVISDGNLYTMAILLVAIVVFPAVMYLFTRNMTDEYTQSYLAGVNTGDGSKFVDSFGGEKDLVVSNWYMDGIFGEKKLTVPCTIISAVIIVVMLCVIMGGAF
ncbi:MAG: NADH-quinone oxidoreductase subunit L [Lachnospiraceae bacterium]|nr:NADH-quinone oxidoreductase subunit L [Lachnospiraceae bacterium]